MFQGRSNIKKGFRAAGSLSNSNSLIQRKGVPLPRGLQRGVEGFSGIDMRGVRVHYNSDKPASVQAFAYTKGRDIYLAPGQEHHLPHEAWHVVQQAQGRVRPTIMVGDQEVNDDPRLEHEADVMGRRAARGW